MLWILLAVGVCIGDLKIKRYIDRSRELNSREERLGGHIIVTKFYNSGAMLGWLRDRQKLLMASSLAIFGGLMAGLGWLIGKEQAGCPQPLTLKAGMALVVGGAASNIYDRIAYRRVTDYFRINIGIKRLERIIFNLGDMAIFLGTILVMISELNKKA